MKSANPNGGVVPNQFGRVMEKIFNAGVWQVPAMYVCGWLKRGPTGIIGRVGTFHSRYFAFKTSTGCKSRVLVRQLFTKPQSRVMTASTVHVTNMTPPGSDNPNHRHQPELRGRDDWRLDRRRAEVEAAAPGLPVQGGAVQLLNALGP